MKGTNLFTHKYINDILILAQRFKILKEMMKGANLFTGSKARDDVHNNIVTLTTRQDLCSKYA